MHAGCNVSFRVFTAQLSIMLRSLSSLCSQELVSWPRSHARSRCTASSACFQQSWPLKSTWNPRQPGVGVDAQEVGQAGRCAQPRMVSAPPPLRFGMVHGSNCPLRAKDKLREAARVRSPGDRFVLHLSRLLKVHPTAAGMCRCLVCLSAFSPPSEADWPCSARAGVWRLRRAAAPGLTAPLNFSLEGAVAENTPPKARARAVMLRLRDLHRQRATVY